MSHVDQGPLPAYNSLVDQHLAGYFSNNRMRRHLRKSGLITKHGEIVSENTYRLNMSRKEHKAHVRDMISQGMVHKILDKERKRQAEIRQKLEQIAKIELVRRVRASRYRKQDNQILPLLSLRPRSGSQTSLKTSSVKGKPNSRYRPISAPARKGRRPISALSSNYEDDEEVVYLDDDGRPIAPSHVDEQELQYASKDPIDSRHLYSLDTQALRKYAMLMAQMEQGRNGGPSPYMIPQVPLPPKSPRSGRTPRSAHRYRSSDSSKSESPKRPATAGQAYLHPAGSAKQFPGQQESMCEVFMVYHGSSLSLAREQFDRRQDIVVEQQPCGSSTLTVFKDKLEPHTKFSFISYRHRGYPFGLSLYIDGKMDSRVSTCCESRHAKGSRIGGKEGHFSIISITGAVPCYKCQVEKGVRVNNQAPRRKMKRPPQNQEEVVVVNTAQEQEPVAPPPAAQEKKKHQEILVPVEDKEEDAKPSDNYEDDFDDSSSSSSSSSSFDSASGREGGLENFQPKDARGVDKTTGKVDINEHSSTDSDSDDDYDDDDRNRKQPSRLMKESPSRKKKKKKRTSKSSSADSSEESDDERGKKVEKVTSLQAKTSPGHVVTEVKPVREDDRKQVTTMKEAPKDVERSISTRPIMMKQEPPKIVQEQVETPKASAVKEDEAVKEERKESTAPAPVKTEFRRQESVSSSVSSSTVSGAKSSDDYSDSDDDARKKKMNGFGSAKAEEDQTDAGRQDGGESKVKKITFAVSEVEEGEKEKNYGIPVGSRAGGEEHSKVLFRIAPGPVMTAVDDDEGEQKKDNVEEEKKEEVQAGSAQSQEVKKVVAESKDSARSDLSSSSSSLSSSSSSGSAAINDKGPNTKNDPTAAPGLGIGSKESMDDNNKVAEKEDVKTNVTTEAVSSAEAPPPPPKLSNVQGNNSTSNSDNSSSSDSDSDNEENKQGPRSVIRAEVDVHYSKDGEQQERNMVKDDGESDPEATHGGNDPDNVAADSGAQAKAIPVVTVSKPNPGSIAPLLEKSRTNMEVKGVSLNKSQVYEAASFLEQAGSLSTINVVNCGIDDDDVQKLKEALKASPSNPVLLNLSLNPLTSNCIDHILDLLEAKPSIEAVLLQGTRVGDGGVKRLVDGILTQHDIRKSQDPEYSEKGVHELDLSDCKMGDEGAFEVARLLTSDLDLDTLTLSYNHAVSEEGWAAIGRALSENKHIETLTLDHNFIGDEGIEIISRGLFNNQSLTALDINDVGLGEKGGKCLMELLKRNTIILEITLMENKLSESQVEDIQRYVALNKAAYNQES